MLYAGVKDVRILDGGWKAWSEANLPVERGMPADVKPAPDFGAPIPGQPQLMIDMAQARGMLHRRMLRWSAFARGRSLLAKPAATATSNPKVKLPVPAGVMPEAMPPIWKISITRTAPCAAPMTSPPCGKLEHPAGTARGLYCGTGWRASEGFMYARAMGWKTSPSMTVAGTNGAATRKTRCRLANADPTVRARA